MQDNGKKKEIDVTFNSENFSAELNKKVSIRATILSLLVTVFLLYFGIRSLLSGHHLYAIVLLGYAVLTVASYYLVFKKQHADIHTQFIVFMIGTLLLFLLYTGGGDDGGLFWFYVFPPLALFVLGLKKGIIAIILLIITSALLILIFETGFDSSIYIGEMPERFIGAFIAVTAMAMVYEYSYQKYTDQLQTMCRDMMLAARSDYLTGLPNRRYVHETITYETYRASRKKSTFSVILCDLDHFKGVNDKYGHSCGDYVLKEISRFIRNNLRNQDTVARWGGEEFLILLPETPVAGALIIGKQLRHKIESLELEYAGNKFSITISMGVIEAKPPYDIEEILNKADENLYVAKQQGRNRIVA